MKRYITIAVMLCAVSAGLLAVKASRADSTTDDAVVRADRTLVAALEKGDKSAVNKLLDADFTWIDTDGIMWSREDALEAGLKPLVPSGSNVIVTEHKYGKIVWVQDNVGSNFAAHVWVQRSGGWRLLHTNEIAGHAVEPGGNVVRPSFTVPCLNPCEEFPYKPQTAGQKAAIDAWHDQESVTADHDKHQGDHFITITSNTLTPPTYHPPQANPNRQHGDAAYYIRAWDTGDTALLVMLQPTYGGKAYWSTRIFSNHDGLWKMEESYHTTIRSAPPMTALPTAVQQSAK